MQLLLYGTEKFLIEKELKNIINKNNFEDINISRYDLEFDTIKNILEDAISKFPDENYRNIDIQKSLDQYDLFRKGGILD